VKSVRREKTRQSPEIKIDVSSVVWRQDSGMSDVTERRYVSETRLEGVVGETVYSLAPHCSVLPP
jgi:hypothetical protein